MESIKMKYLKKFIVLLFLVPFPIHAQDDTSFNLRQTLGEMMQLEQQYTERKESAVANKLVMLYKIISENYVDSSDYYTFARSRMLVELRRYDDAIALLDTLLDKDKELYKERVFLMKASYDNDTNAFNQHLNAILDYLDVLTSEYLDIEDSIMRIPIRLGFSSSIDMYVYKLFEMKHCYHSISVGRNKTCWQLINYAQKGNWDLSQLNWLLKTICEFNYMSLTWW